MLLSLVGLFGDVELGATGVDFVVLANLALAIDDDQVRVAVPAP